MRKAERAKWYAKKNAPQYPLRGAEFLMVLLATILF